MSCFTILSVCWGETLAKAGITLTVMPREIPRADFVPGQGSHLYSRNTMNDTTRMTAIATTKIQIQMERSFSAFASFSVTSFGPGIS